MVIFSSKVMVNSNKNRIFVPEKLFVLSKNVRFLLSALSKNKDNLLLLKSRNGSSFIWIPLIGKLRCYVSEDREG